MSNGKDKDHTKQNNQKEVRSVGPDISVIPINRELKEPPQIKNKNNDKEGLEIIPKTRSPRQQVRLVSKEEALKAEAELQATIIKRKSLPLEKCHICKKFFRRMKTHLQKHAADVQNEIVPGETGLLHCKFCSKVFNSGSNLSIHMRTHTGDKPFVCDVSYLNIVF